jgi:hypothetical protein
MVLETKFPTNLPEAEAIAQALPFSFGSTLSGQGAVDSPTVAPNIIICISVTRSILPL